MLRPWLLFLVCGVLAVWDSAPLVAQTQGPSPRPILRAETSQLGTLVAAQQADADSPEAADATTTTPSLTAAVKGLPRDVWHFVSFDTAKIAGIGLAGALTAHHWDASALEELQENVRFTDFENPGNTYGSFAVQTGGAFGTYLVGRWSRHPRLAQVGLDLVRVQVVTQAWVQAVKLSVNRERPDGTAYSFPSGHVASSFATAGIVRREFGWKAGLPMYGLGSYVAAARIAQNHHYLSDVVFGAVLGIASAHSVTIGHGTHEWRVSPTVDSGSVGVLVSLADSP